MFSPPGATDRSSPIQDRDVDYALRRSEAEALRALAADDARAASAHRELGLLHARRAIAWLNDPN